MNYSKRDHDRMLNQDFHWDAMYDLDDLAEPLGQQFPDDYDQWLLDIEADYAIAASEARKQQEAAAVHALVDLVQVDDAELPF